MEEHNEKKKSRRSLEEKRLIVLFVERVRSHFDAILSLNQQFQINHFINDELVALMYTNLVAE